MTVCYVCPAGHVMPSDDLRVHVVPCRYLVAARMECSRDAVRTEHTPCECGVPYLPTRPFQCVHEFERRAPIGQ